MTARKPLPPETTKAKQPHRWPKGRSGNPAGRPRGSKHQALALLDALGTAAAVGIANSVIAAALAGDLRAAEIVLSRLWPARRGRPVRLDLPEITCGADLAQALAAVVRATAAGIISPEEASAVGGVLEMQGRALEHAELESRIAALEAALEAAGHVQQ